MPLDRLDFENLQENDLIELLNAQVPEGLYLDYKTIPSPKTEIRQDG